MLFGGEKRHFMDEFLGLSGDVLDGLLYTWPITLILILLVIAAGVVGIKRGANARQLCTPFVPFVAPVVLLALGVIFRNAGNDQVLYGAIFGFLVLAIYATWKAQGMRLYALAAVSLIAHITFWSAFVASMSISGDWL